MADYNNYNLINTSLSNQSEKNKNKIEIFTVLDDKKDKIVKKQLYNEKELYDLFKNADSWNCIHRKIKEIDFYLLFLSLLIRNIEEDVCVYSSINFLKLVNKYKLDKKNTNIQTILISKIILFLIDKLEFKEEDEEEKQKIKKENKEYIEDNDYMFKQEFNLNYDITDKQIDFIYMEIIISLIRDKKYNYEYCVDKIEEIKYDKIFITETIKKGLIEEINAKNTYIKQYNIEEINDLDEMKKIKFFYLLQ
jgi:hypothetical protein